MTPSNEDIIEMEILPDGTSRLTTPGLEGANHVRADALVGAFAKFLGGDLKVEKNPNAHRHAHHHQGQGHKHGH